MARRTATITHIQYWKKRARGDDKVRDVSRLPDGSDLLTFIYGVWQGLPDRSLWNRARQLYCTPEEPICDGRTVVFTARVGSYGDASSVEHIETGYVVLDNEDGNYTNAVRQRLVLLVPQHATSAFLVIEHFSGGGLGGRFLEHVERAWRQRFPDWTLHIENLTRADAWIAQAQLSKISARIYGHSSDAVDNFAGRKIGTMQVVLVPEGGTRYFPKALREAIVGRQVTGAALLGTSEEPDELLITLGDGEQEKTFAVGKEKTPPVRYVVTDYGTRALTPNQFRAWAISNASGHFKDVGASWNAAWSQGEWDDEALKSRVEIVDDE